MGGGFNGILFLVDSNTRLPALAPDGKPFLLTVDRAREIFDMVRKLGARDPGDIAPKERRTLREFAENVEAYLDIGKRGRSRLRRIKDRRIKRPESLGEPGSGSRSGAKKRPRWVIDSNSTLALVDPDTGKPVLASDGKPFSLAPGRSREIFDLLGAWGAKDAGKMTREELRTLHEFARNVDAYLGVGEPDRGSGPKESTDEKAPKVVAREPALKKKEKKRPARLRPAEPIPEIDKEEGNALTRWLRELRESFEDFFKLPSDLPPPGGPPTFPVPLPPPFPPVPVPRPR